MARIYFTAAMLMCFLTGPLLAAQSTLDGTWNSALVVNGQRCAIQLIMSPGQRYSEAVKCGGIMIWQAGTYVFANGTLVRSVVDWQPKQRYVLDTGYSGHYEANAKPPGGSSG